MNRLVAMYTQLTSLLDRDRVEHDDNNESESSFQAISVPLEYSRGTGASCVRPPLPHACASLSQSVGQVAQSAQDRWRCQCVVG
jgi:hypothetical protein